MHLTGALALIWLALAPTVLGAGSDSWRSRTIYQVFTDRYARTDGSTTAACDTGTADYCGGTWTGIINQLDRIQDLGFDAIWISPITHQVEGLTADGSAYHGYWQDDIDSVNENFGTADDLKALSAELHNRDMVSKIKPRPPRKSLTMAYFSTSWSTLSSTISPTLDLQARLTTAPSLSSLTRVTSTLTVPTTTCLRIWYVLIISQLT